MSQSTHLVVWMNGERVGVWAQPRAGSPSFQYDADWVASPAARVLSLSLPFTPSNAPHRGETVTYFFDNLLPDSTGIRARLQSRFAQDCVGAVQLLPEDETPQGFNRVEAEPLDEAGVEQAINTALSGGRVLGQAHQDEFQISIAGAQEKTALLFHRNRWCRPQGTTPTTHILKLPLGLVGNLQADMQDSVENEWLCSRLLQAFGLETAHCEIARFGNRKVLAVQRFDRAWQGKQWIARLPQEDFCQALGQPARLKYEADGGPGMTAILRVLATSARAEQDKRAFVKAQLVFWLLAATDGHAKNFSLFHERGGTYRLTPFYDVLSAWPIIGPGPRQLTWQKAKLAMAVRSRNAHWKLKDILPRHWDAVTRVAGLGEASRLIAEVLRQTPEVIAQVSRQLPPGFPARVSDRIFAGLQKQAMRLGGEP